MKPFNLILIAAFSLPLASCADFLPSSGRSTRYQREAAARRADMIRRQYWQEQNQPVAGPALEKRYTAITIPAQTLPDGTLIEAHTEYVQTVH